MQALVKGYGLVSECEVIGMNVAELAELNVFVVNEQEDKIRAQRKVQEQKINQHRRGKTCIYYSMVTTDHASAVILTGNKVVPMSHVHIDSVLSKATRMGAGVRHVPLRTLQRIKKGEAYNG